MVNIRKREDYLRRKFPNWKCIGFNLNAALFVLSLIHFGASVWLLVTNDFHENAQLNIRNYSAAKITFMLCALVNILLSLVVCFSAANDEIQLLKTYLASSIMVTILDVITLCMVLSYGLGSKVRSYMLVQISELMEDRIYDDDSNWFLNRLQQKYKCCGTTGSQSYLQLYKDIPLSCGTPIPSQQGCVEALGSYLSGKAAVIIGFSVPTFLLQLACLLNVVGIYWESKRSRKYTPGRPRSYFKERELDDY